MTKEQVLGYSLGCTRLITGLAEGVCRNENPLNGRLLRRLLPFDD